MRRPAAIATRRVSAGRRDTSMRLTDGIEPVADHPRRGRIAVDGHGRSVLGPVGERLAVAGRADCEALDASRSSGVRRRRRRTRAGVGRRCRAAAASLPGPPVSVNPMTSCVPRHWWARSRFESVTTTRSASSSDHRRARSAAYRTASSPFSRPAAAASTIPSPLPDSTTRPSTRRGPSPRAVVDTRRARPAAAARPTSALRQRGLVDHGQRRHVRRSALRTARRGRGRAGWRRTSRWSARAAACGTGRRPCRWLTQIVSAPKRRATGAIAAGSRTLRLGAVVERVQQVHRAGRCRAAAGRG